MVSWNYYETTDTDKNKSFVDAYKTMFGQDRVTSDPAEAAYDAVYLWKAACEKAGSFEVDDVLDAIHTGEISFDAPEGTVTINSENQHLCKAGSHRSGFRRRPDLRGILHRRSGRSRSVSQEL